MTRRRAAHFFLGLLASAILATGCASPAPTTLRVLTYNIHHGEGNDGKVDLARIAGIITQCAPDLVALQEVDRGVKRTNGIDEPAELGRLTGMEPIFEKNIIYQGGEYGNAVLTRLPVVSWRNHHLPQSLPKEQRGVLEVNVRVAGRELMFLATHLDYHPDEGERLQSAKMLSEMVRARNLPVILAGDFNSLPDSVVMKEFAEFLQDSGPAGAMEPFTYPGDKPIKRIDFILHNARGLRCIHYEVLSEAIASDHRPVLSVFEVTRPASP